MPLHLIRKDLVYPNYLNNNIIISKNTVIIVIYY